MICKSYDHNITLVSLLALVTNAEIAKIEASFLIFD